MGILDVFSTSAGAMSAQTVALQNISTNIANTSTPGFKATDTTFSDLIPDTSAVSQTSGAVGANTRSSLSVAGANVLTGVSTNMALSGTGYFAVAQNTGTADAPAFSGPTLYTRRGDFALDGNGYLTNGAGFSLTGTSYNPASGSASGSVAAPIHVASALGSGATLGDVSVGSDGTLTGTYSDGTTLRVGQAAVAQIGRDASLTSVGSEAYALSSTATAPLYGLNGGAIQGGAVEGSNTNITDQFSKMIATQQAYESNSKVLTAANEMAQDAINLVA